MTATACEFHSDSKNERQVYWWLAAIILFGILARIVEALSSDLFMHDDEALQALEQGHRYAFGYGIIPWEYRFGTRSWILPMLIGGVLKICDSVGWGDPSIYIPVVKLVTIGFTIWIIPAAYWIGKQLGSVRTGLLAAFMVATWYDIIWHAHRPIGDILPMTSYLLLLAFSLRYKPSYWIVAVSAIAAVFTVATRIQLLLMLIVPLFILLQRWDRTRVIAFIGICLASVTACGLVDYWTWGIFGISYYNNIYFNQYIGVASFYVIEPWYFYLERLTLKSCGIIPLAIVWGIFRQKWSLVLPILLVLIFHSFVPHKEDRFVLIVEPLSMVLVAILIDEIWALISPRWGYRLIALVVAGNIACAVAAYEFSSIGTRGSDASLKAYKTTLYQASDLKGIIHFATGPTVGGYYHLHRPVPLFVSPYPNNDLTHWIASFSPFANYILCPSGYPEIKDFKLIQTIGNMEIRKKGVGASTAEYNEFDYNAKDPRIDGHYIPNVKPFL